MKLSKVVISGFRSITQAQTLLVDERTTVLIGANDHGKTNVLEAIRCLNDDSPIQEEDKNWDLPEEAHPRIEWHFTFDKEEERRIDEHIGRSRAGDAVPEEEQTWYGGEGERQIVYAREGAGQPVTVMTASFKYPANAADAILALRPRVELFAPPTTNIPDSTNQAELAEDLVMQGIFRLAGIWDERDKIFTRNAVTSKRLDEASKHLTEALRDKWNQGKSLTWQLKHAADRIEIEINDPSISSRYSRPSQRSSGFRTYFLLSMITSAKTASHPDTPFIFLFDEPGTYLHPHAQIDLQRSFEKIAEQAQIVYTTHSLFLINKNHPGRNKVVNKTADGTLIDQKPFRRNWKSVRDSLGILFSNNFLIAEKTLLVEGPSDIVYILGAINQLKAGGQVDIDLNDLSIVDAGTSENYIAMCKLMLSEGRTVVALVDGDKSGNQLQEKLRKACDKELGDKTLSMLPLPAGTSVEDLFVDIEILRKATRGGAEELVAQGIRTLANPTMDWDGELARITRSSTATLGYVFDRVTEEWFDPKEKISKLSASLMYEDLAKGNTVNLDPQAKQWVNKIQKQLGIRGEAAFEKGVYETV